MAKKDFGRRLMPEYLLKYAEELNKNHPDPSASWGGGGGGGDYTAGEGIDITGDVISIDEEVVAKKTDIPDVSDFVTDTDLNTALADYELKSEAFSGSYNDLTDKPTIPTKTSDLQNDSGFITGVDWDDVENKPTFATVATSGDYDDLLNKPTIPTVDYPVTDVKVDGVSVVSNKVASITMPTVPTKTSDLQNDSGFITSSALSGYATETWVGQQGYLTSVSWNDVSSKPTFATVATTGDYDDLLNKPTIPTVNCNIIQITRTYSNGSWTENWPDQATTALIKANPERYAFIVKTVNEDTIEISFSPLLTATLENPGSPIYYRWGANVADSSNITTCTVTVNIMNQWWYSEATSSYSPYTAGTGISISSGSISVDTTTVALKSEIPDTTNFVTTNTTQTITGTKTFSNGISETYNLDSGSGDSHSYSTTFYADEIRYVDSISFATVHLLFPEKRTGLYTLATTEDIPSLSGYATETWVGQQGFLTGITSAMISSALGYTPGTSNFSGSYTDLTDKPSIPSTASSTSTVTPTTQTLVFTLDDDSTVTVNVMTGATVSTTTTLS